MLPPNYLRDLPEAILALYREVELEILSDMARRLVKYNYWIPAAEHQRCVLLELGRTQEEVLSALAAITDRSKSALKQLMQEASQKALNSDLADYLAAGMQVPNVQESESLRRILRIGYQATAKTMQNITHTTASSASKQFEEALDRIWLQVSSGAFDADAAIRAGIEDLAEQGVGAIRYPSGRTDSLETAVRRAIVTGANQTALQQQVELADEVGCDLVETTAHAGARPSHAVWQGRIFSRSGESLKYPDFVSSTGYGTGAGLGGWNCRHSFHPYIEGAPRAYSEQMLRDYDAENYAYNGQKLTEYEATQRQREIERNIRRWKREQVMMEAAGQDATEAASKLRRWQGKQRDFIQQTGLKRQWSREQI